MSANGTNIDVYAASTMEIVSSKYLWGNCIDFCPEMKRNWFNMSLGMIDHLIEASVLLNMNGEKSSKYNFFLSNDIKHKAGYKAWVRVLHMALLTYCHAMDTKACCYFVKVFYQNVFEF